MTTSVMLNSDGRHLDSARGSPWFDNFWFWLRLLKISTMRTIIGARNTGWLAAIASDLRAAQIGEQNPGPL